MKKVPDNAVQVLTVQGGAPQRRFHIVKGAGWKGQKIAGDVNVFKPFLGQVSIGFMSDVIDMLYSMIYGCRLQGAGGRGQGAGGSVLHPVIAICGCFRLKRFGEIIT